MTARPPADVDLLTAGGWSSVPDACVLAKGWDGDFCAALINTHGGDESSVYFTIVECFRRTTDDAWVSLGHSGPVPRSGGAGWHVNGGDYEYRWDELTGWRVTVVADTTASDA